MLKIFQERFWRIIQTRFQRRSAALFSKLDGVYYNSLVDNVFIKNIFDWANIGKMFAALVVLEGLIWVLCNQIDISKWYPIVCHILSHSRGRLQQVFLIWIAFLMLYPGIRKSFLTTIATIKGIFSAIRDFIVYSIKGTLYLCCCPLEDDNEEVAPFPAEVTITEESSETIETIEEIKTKTE